MSSEGEAVFTIWVPHVPGNVPSARYFSSNNMIEKNTRRPVGLSADNFVWISLERHDILPI